MKKYLKAYEIREMLNISRNTLERWIAEGKFPKPDVHISRVRLWEDEALRQWLTDRKPQQAAAV